MFFTSLFATVFFIYKSPVASFRKPSIVKEAPKVSPLFYETIGSASYEVNFPAEKLPLPEQYTVELGVATSQNQALQLMNELSGKGVKAYYTPYHDQGRVVYRIRKGVFASRKQAEKELEKLAEKKLSYQKIVAL